MKPGRQLLIGLLISHALFSSRVFAHHGKDYFINKSYHTLSKGMWAGFLSADYIRLNLPEEEQLRGFGLEPGFLYGLSNHWSFEIHAHIEKMSGERWHYESTGIEQRFQITRWDGEEDRPIPIDVAGAVEFEKNSSDEAPDVLVAGLILSNDGLAHNVTGNLLLRRELRPHARTELRYALGAKREFSQFVGIGIEFNGNLSGQTLEEVTPGLYFQTDSGLKINIGLSLGVAENRGDYSLRSSFVLDF